MEIYYQRALAIYIKKLGEDDPNVAKTKNNLVCGCVVCSLFGVDFTCHVL